MMIWKNLDSVYFIGIGGIGMSALARYFVSQGKEVAGYDRVTTSLTDQLSREGINIHFEDRSVLIPDAFRNPERTLVIYTPAVPEQNQQLNYFRKRGFRVIKRAVALGEVFNAGRGIGVAGTHGKTSISAILAHILHNSTLGCNAFLGGISKNRRNNLYLDTASQIVIAEADEYDHSFLTLFPEIAVVSSMDPDHLDIYQSSENLVRGFETFISQIRGKGKLIQKYGLEPAVPDNIERYTYALNNRHADYYTSKLKLKEKKYEFTVVTPDLIIPKIKLGVYGMLMVENILAAIAVAHQLGIAPEVIARALASYQGVERRFDLQVENENRIYIDDYAHHPEEIRAFLSSVRALYPGEKITGVFQPHLYSRTRDFAAEFARSLEALDALIMMEIYPAREDPIQGVSSSMILDRMNIKEKVLVSREQLMQVIRESDPRLLVTMGAGDIDEFVEPIRDWMDRK